MAPNGLAGLIGKVDNDPAAEPPHSVSPDFINPPNGNRLAYAVIGISVIVVALSSLLRVYSKVFCVRRVTIEDWLGLISIPFFVATIWALCQIPREAGFFVHQWDLKVKDLEWFLYYSMLSRTLSCVVLLLAKTMILLEISHVFAAHRNNFYWVCWGMIIAIAISYTATIWTVNFACTPRERSWRPSVPGTCINYDAFNISIAAFLLTSDISMLLLPQIVIWKLVMTKKQKIGVSVVFSAGALACIWAGGRLASASVLFRSSDITDAYSRYMMWGLGEVATAVLVFCAPAFPVAFRKSSPISTLFRLLGSKLKMFFSSRKTSNPNLKSSKSPQEAYRMSLSSSLFPQFDSVSNPSFAEVEPVKIEGGRKSNEEALEPVFGGILISTEIEIKSHEVSTSKGLYTIQEVTQPSW